MFTSDKDLKKPVAKRIAKPPTGGKSSTNPPPKSSLAADVASTAAMGSNSSGSTNISTGTTVSSTTSDINSSDDIVARAKTERLLRQQRREQSVYATAIQRVYRGFKSRRCHFAEWTTHLQNRLGDIEKLNVLMKQKTGLPLALPNSASFPLLRIIVFLTTHLSRSRKDKDTVNALCLRFANIVMLPALTQMADASKYLPFLLFAATLSEQTKEFNGRFLSKFFCILLSVAADSPMMLNAVYPLLQALILENIDKVAVNPDVETSRQFLVQYLLHRSNIANAMRSAMERPLNRLLQLHEDGVDLSSPSPVAAYQALRSKTISSSGSQMEDLVHLFFRIVCLQSSKSSSAAIGIIYRFLGVPLMMTLFSSSDLVLSEQLIVANRSLWLDIFAHLETNQALWSTLEDEEGSYLFLITTMKLSCFLDLCLHHLLILCFLIADDVPVSTNSTRAHISRGHAILGNLAVLGPLFLQLEASNSANADLLEGYLRATAQVFALFPLEQAVQGLQTVIWRHTPAVASTSAKNSNISTEGFHDTDMFDRLSITLWTSAHILRRQS